MTKRWLVVLLVLAGCAGEAPPPDGGVDAYVAPPPYAGELDLLFVIDDTMGTSGYQAALAMQIPSVVHRLVTGDGVTSLHVGIVTNDMGVDMAEGIVGCDSRGDDGLMRLTTRGASGSCAADYTSTFASTPHVLSFATGTSDEATFSTDVACVAAVGEGGCGFTQHLESMLAAVSLDAPTSWTRPGYVPPTFYGGAQGHGSDMATNGSFLRAGSILVVVVMGNEDDCSAADTSMYQLEDPITPGTPLSHRCFAHADRLQPVSRYVDGLVGLHDPSRIVFSAIMGMPSALAGHPPSEVLADPAMQARVDPSAPNAFLPACATPRAVGFPGARLARLAQALEEAHAHVLLESICDSGDASQVDALVQLTQRAIHDAQ